MKRGAEKPLRPARPRGWWRGREMVSAFLPQTKETKEAPPHAPLERPPPVCQEPSRCCGYTGGAAGSLLPASSPPLLEILVRSAQKPASHSPFILPGRTKLLPQGLSRDFLFLNPLRRRGLAFEGPREHVGDLCKMPIPQRVSLDSVSRHVPKGNLTNELSRNSCCEPVPEAR